MGLKAAWSGFPSGAGIKAPANEAEQLCVMHNVLHQTGCIPAAVSLGVAHLLANLGAGSVNPLEFNGRKLPIHTETRCGMRQFLRYGGRLMACIARETASADAALTGVNRHTMRLPFPIAWSVDALAHRIAQFPADSINACKQMVYESIDKPIDEALKAEAYWLYQATSKTPAIKRFTIADEQGLEHDIENQRNWGDLVMKVQEIND